MGNEFKVLPTYYNGILFRSRLEARWAMFLDYLRVPWFYEYEGFELDGIRYLPDFYLPLLECWIEIKPVKPSGKERMKCERLAKATETSTYLFWGIPRKWDGRDDGPAYAWTSALGFDWDTGYNFVQCYKCGAIHIDYCGQNSMYCHRCHFKTDNETLRLTMAREVARTFRFDDFLTKKMQKGEA